MNKFIILKLIIILIYTNQQQRFSIMIKPNKSSKTKQTSKAIQIQQKEQPKNKVGFMEAEQNESGTQSESQFSSEDEDGKLLTNKVQQKLLTIVAKLRNKDPEIYKVDKPIFEDNDFEKQQKQGKKINKVEVKSKNKKITYEQMIKQNGSSDSDQENGNKQEINLADIKQNLKKKLIQNTSNENQDQLFRIKKKAPIDKKSNAQKLQQLTGNFSKQSSDLLNKLWKNDQNLDKTDLFLRNYILNEKWKSSKIKENELLVDKQKQEMIDQQDEQRSVQMDEYQANYNFRYQQPGSDKIIQYPRQIPQSIRQTPQTRKQKRKKLSQRKKEEQQKIRKQNEIKKEQKKKQILEKLQEIDKKKKQEQNRQNRQNIESESDFDHDWFFCDDCAKALEEKEEYYVCNQCGEYMLCEECYGIIIHKHAMERGVIPKGSGPPPSQKAQKALKSLKSCKTCRKKIPNYLKHYSYNENGSKITHNLCQKCYDESGLDIKKKFHEVQPSNKNYSEMLQKYPQQIKQLHTQQDIDELVDEYLKYDFQDVIGGGLKTKFKYISVKPQSYGLSDEQILYGDDKQLNKYISIKKLGAYNDNQLKLRNNQYNKKIKSIKKSASQNKKLINKIGNNSQALRSIKKIQTRAELIKKRRQNRNKKLRIINISNEEDQKKLLLRKSRLESYGVQVEEGVGGNGGHVKRMNGMEEQD